MEMTREDALARAIEHAEQASDKLRTISGRSEIAMSFAETSRAWSAIAALLPHRVKPALDLDVEPGWERI